MVAPNQMKPSIGVGLAEQLADDARAAHSR